LNDGQGCTPNGGTPCLNGCTQWFTDHDKDGFGDPNIRTVNTCGTAPPGTPPGGGQFVRQSGDCCDTDPNAKPGQPGDFVTPRGGGCPGPAFDYNCSGGEEKVFRDLGGGPVINNILSGFPTCQDLGQNCANITLIWPGGQPPPCGSTGGQGTGVGSQCFLVDPNELCQGVSGFGVDIYCK